MDIFSHSPITYEFLKPGEEDEFIDLILTRFNEFVASGYSDPNVVGAYETMDFIAEGPEQCINGIRMVPMGLSIKQQAI